MDKKFEDFKVGDVYVFEKLFKKSEFNMFSKLSGDKNPLHHDEDYAKLTVFNKTVVPMHLAAAPLSSVAGMVFPGLRSLYLSHEVKSHLPIFFNEKVIYSSKIIGKNDAENVLIIRTIVYKDTYIMLSAIQKVQVRNEKIDTKSLKNYKLQGSISSNTRSFTLITGAGGEIGQATAMQLAKKGKNLVLIFRKINKENTKFVEKIMQYSPDVQVLEMDLSSDKVKQIFTTFIEKNIGFIECIIFIASPKIDANIKIQMAVNYSSLKSIVECCLPYWLQRQFGKVIYLSSSAVHYHPMGFDDYSTAKAAGTNYIDGIRKRFLQSGIEAYCLAAGKVDTKFSDKLNTRDTNEMLPEQVAEHIINLTEIKNSSHFYFWLEYSGLRVGSYDFVGKNNNTSEDLRAVEKKHTQLIAPLQSNSLKIFMIDFFNLDVDTNWDSVGIGLISGWDSLRHIEFILKIEEQYSIKFTSEEIDKTTTYHDLHNLLDKKLNDHE